MTGVSLNNFDPTILKPYKQMKMESLTSPVNTDFSQPANLVENAIQVLFFKTDINAKLAIEIIGLELRASLKTAFFISLIPSLHYRRVILSF